MFNYQKACNTNPQSSVVVQPVPLLFFSALLLAPGAPSEPLELQSMQEALGGPKEGELPAGPAWTWAVAMDGGRKNERGVVQCCFSYVDTYKLL